MGTTLGMITFVEQLGITRFDEILRSSMAIGLVATLYGIAFANLVFIPMAENLSKMTR